MTNEYLANRYGKSPKKARNQRVLWTIVGAALLVTFLVWSLLVNFAAPANLSASVKNFDLKSAQNTSVTITVNSPTSRDGVCAIRVLNKSFAIIGYKELAINGGSGTQFEINTSVNTTELGVSATVDRCWLK
ncbi:MAG: DUF4307 domain-containing protein [Rhodoluna sp.]